jgi:hypothetical protein
MFKSNPNPTKLTKPQKNAKIPKSVKKAPAKSQKRQLHSPSPRPNLTTRSLLTPKRLFSTTPQETTETQQTQQTQQTQRPTDQELEEHRSRFKTIVSTMNSDQQMVVQALVAESVMLRGELKNLAVMTQQHQEQAQSVLQQLEEIKASGVVRGGAEQSEEIEEGDEFHHLDVNSPTYYEDMIEVEKHPRVRQALIRENQLRKEIKPLIEIIEIAAKEKQDWKKRSNRSALGLFLLSGLVIGQSIILYTGSTSNGSHMGGVEHVDMLNSCLQDSIAIINDYNSQSGQKTTTVTPDAHSPVGKWNVLKEKMRLYNLAHPKNQIQSVSPNLTQE